MGRARLVAINPADRKAREFALSDAETTVGTDSANRIALPDASVSRRHAVIRLRDGRHVLRDLELTNGTFVNGRRIRSPIALADGDRVRFGGASFVFLDPGIATPRIRPRRPIVRTLEYLLVVFLIAFGATEYRLNREHINEAVRNAASGIAPLPVATAATAIAPTGPIPYASPAGAEATAAEPGWLTRMNYYRAMVKIAPVTEDPALSIGDLNHARYMVKNRSPMDAGTHDEDPSNPWYTPEGRAAARSSDLIPPCYRCPRFSGAQAIDLWMVGPFHRMLILNPDLRRVGFGEFHEDDLHGYAITLGTAPTRPFDPPIAFPPDAAAISLGSLRGEWPNPLASCPGYSRPAGLPITLEFGPGTTPQVSAYSIIEGGKQLEVCEIDQTNYSNPDREQESRGRSNLTYFGAIMLVPRDELEAGQSYSVSITSADRTYAWSFTIEPASR